jgi:LEA14-like dessication related protein
MKYSRLLCVVAIVITIFSSGCNVLPLEFGDVEHVDFKGVKDKRVHVEVTIPITNPNKFRFKVVDMNIKILSGRDSMGIIEELDNIVVPARTEKMQTFGFSIGITDLVGTGMSLFKFYAKKEMPLRIKGYVIVKAYGIRKRIEVDEKFNLEMNKKNK